MCFLLSSTMCCIPSCFRCPYRCETYLEHIVRKTTAISLMDTYIMSTPYRFSVLSVLAVPSVLFVLFVLSVFVSVLSFVFVRYFLSVLSVFTSNFNLHDYCPLWGSMGFGDFGMDGL